MGEHGSYDLRELPGGRIGVAGYAASFGSPTPFCWLASLDAGTGDVLTEAAINSSFGGVPDGARVAADGGALFLGRDVIDVSVKHDAWVMRAEPSGNILWSKRFTNVGAGRYRLLDAAEIEDGSWIAVGTSSVLDQPPQHAWIVRFSATGAVLWQAEYGAGNSETARSVTPTADGGFAVAGWTDSSGGGSDDVWVMKIDSLGAIQWQETFGDSGVDRAQSIIEVDGGLVIAGSMFDTLFSNLVPLVLRLDASGGLVWHTELIRRGSMGELRAIRKTRTGRLIAVGHLRVAGSLPTRDLWCVRLRPTDGREIWERAYQGESDDSGSAILELRDGSLVAGGTSAKGFPGESVWLTRARADGTIDCSFARSTSIQMLMSSPRTMQPASVVAVAPTAHAAGVGIQQAPSRAEAHDVCR